MTFSLVLGFDLTRISAEASNEQLYDAATAFFEQLVKKSGEEQRLGTDLSHLWNETFTPERAQILLNTARKIHDHKLDKQGQFGALRQCNQYPFDPKLRKKKKFRREYNYTKILDRKTQLYYDINFRKNDTVKAIQKISTKLQVRKLCRGGHLRVITLCISTYCKDSTI